MAHTHTPRQNKDDSTFEQGSNKTVIVIKNKNAISGCHGNQHSRTPGNVVKHATEHKAAKQVKRLFIRLQHVVQCPLVRAQETHKRVQISPRRRCRCPRAPEPPAGQHVGWEAPERRRRTRTRGFHRSRGGQGTVAHKPSHPGPWGTLPQQDLPAPATCSGLAGMKAALGLIKVGKHNPRSRYVFLRTESVTIPCPETSPKLAAVPHMVELQTQAQIPWSPACHKGTQRNNSAT